MSQTVTLDLTVSDPEGQSQSHKDFEPNVTVKHRVIGIHIGHVPALLDLSDDQVQGHSGWVVDGWELLVLVHMYLPWNCPQMPAAQWLPYQIYWAGMKQIKEHEHFHMFRLRHTGQYRHIITNRY